MIRPNNIDRCGPARRSAFKGIGQTSHCAILALLGSRLVKLRRKFVLLVLTLLILPGFAVCSWSQSIPNNPLSPSYLPSIDANAADYAGNIWITDTMQKVRQDSGSPGTQHWGTFYGTQNEFVDFQVHYHDMGSGTQNLSVTVSNFVQTAPSAFTISAAPTPLPPKVVVYREAYMDVTFPTATSALYYGTKGYFPDALIPTVDPYWGQTTNAWPFNVPAGDNQSAWIDVLIPKNAPSGYYLGTVTVKSGSTTLATMPVILAVWQWPSAGSMPSTTTLKTEETGWGYGAMCAEMYTGTASGNDNGCANYPNAGGGADSGVTMTWLDGDLLMKDHRFDSGGPENVYPNLNGNNFSSYNSLVAPIMNGGCTHGGSVCPVLPNSQNTTKNVGISGAVTQAAMNAWESDFVTNGWTTRGNTPLYYYLWDEPGTNSGNWSSLVSEAATYHAYASPGPGIPLLVTADLTDTTNGNGLNAVDIMVTLINQMDPQGGTLQRSTYNSWLSGNCCGAGVSPTRQLWSYQSCNSAGCSNGYASPTAHWPNVYVDSFPAGNRVMEWLTFLHNQSGELYYNADYCYNQSVGGCPPPNASAPYDPWVSNYVYGSWGDGTLIYVGCVVPGHPCFMGAGVTTPIILPSIRLNHMRDGVQDYEYLNALTNAGQGPLVQQQIGSWITNSYTFEETGTGLQTARLALGTALHQLTYGGAGVTLNPPTNVQAIVQKSN